MAFSYFLLSLLAFLTINDGFLTEDDLTSPFVFDPTFYINTHSDLHHIHTIEEAKGHWVQYGIKEGRQACGSFHSKQYIQRYPDLTKAFGNNYRMAIKHYLMFGLSEKRLGYIEGGGESRWTISSPDHQLFISASRRTAGAIDSLVWNHREFINSWDHGRELQIATNTHPYGECFNPTEAGGRDDGGADTTTSKLIHITAEGTFLQTTNHPAFWLDPGDKESQPITAACGVHSPALNTQKLYNYDFSKTVTIGCAGMNHCVKFVSNITIGGHWPDGYQGFNFEAPTGYLTGDFHVLTNYDLKTKRITEYSDNKKPVILQTKDAKYAMGVFAPGGQNTDAFQYYVAKAFGRSFTSGTNKWSVVFRKNRVPDNSIHHMIYTVYICVGTKTMVTDCLDKVYNLYPHL